MQQTKQVDFAAAYNCSDLATFMSLAFPDEWMPAAARILESGAEFGALDRFAPRWTNIPFTQRHGKSDLENQLKSVIFRVHDCLHQLWGLPVPSDFSEETRINFKRMWMCAEIAVLTLVEFFYCQWLYDTQPVVRHLLEKRGTLCFKSTTELRHKTMQQTAQRLDELLHKQTLPHWVRDNEYGVRFCEDFVPMLAQDRVNIDHNWSILCAMPAEQLHALRSVPNQRYSKRLDGLEMTVGMISDFEHILAFTGNEVDEALAEFNRHRRRIEMPPSWNEGPTQFNVKHTAAAAK